jgi:hypothetical protein
MVKFLKSFSLIDTPPAFGEKNLSMAIYITSNYSMEIIRNILNHSMATYITSNHSMEIYP